MIMMQPRVLLCWALLWFGLVVPISIRVFSLSLHSSFSNKIMQLPNYQDASETFLIDMDKYITRFNMESYHNITTTKQRAITLSAYFIGCTVQTL